MYFSIHNILPIYWISLAIAILSGLFLVIRYRRFITLPSQKTPENDASIPTDSELPGVSVIVYVRENPGQLRRMLPEVLGQNYPAGKFEVIVVNDGSDEDVTDIVNLLAPGHRNLYITFVPSQAHSLSRKKLALSLGIKAARKEVVVVTATEAMPCSPRWLRSMVSPFTRVGGSKDVVLGAARIDSLKKPLLIFDECARTTTWLSAALNGHPYRGTGYNLAYRRELFFNAKGFARSLNLQNGDDDIFVNQIVNSGNTAVVITPEAIVDLCFHNPESAFRDLRLRHSFTRRFLPKGASRKMGAGSLAAWLWLIATVTGIVFSLPNCAGALLMVLLIPAVWIPLTLAWRGTLSVLGIRLNAWLIWWCQLWRWTSTLKCRMMCTSSSRHNYTFEKKRV